MASKLNPHQIQQDVHNETEHALQTKQIAGTLVTEKFDEVDLTYILAGPGTGEVGTVVYKLDGNTVATLTLTYDGSNNLTNIVKS